MLQFGRFRFLDVGDLSGPPLYSLACPSDRIGPIDLYLVAHHGGPDAAEPATFAAFKPRAAMVNNGPFLLTEWRLNDRIRLTRNPRYWDAANVRLSTVDVLSAPTPNTWRPMIRPISSSVSNSI